MEGKKTPEVMEGKLKEMAAKFLYVSVFPALKRHPEDFSRCQWMPQLFVGLLCLETYP
jgi:hypothetical protein